MTKHARLWLAVGTVGAVIVGIWLLLLPFTLSGSSRSATLPALWRQWRNSSATEPIATDPFRPGYAQGLAEARSTPERPVVADPAGSFVAAVPAGMAVMSLSDGVVVFGNASGTLSIAYPATSTNAIGTTTPVVIGGQSALLTTNGPTSVLVWERSAGYVVVQYVGTQAINGEELLAGVQFIR